MPDYTIDGKCREGCGLCCTNALPVNDHEINKIKKYVRRNGIQDTMQGEGICPFLAEEKRCLIYIHRPEICRWYICSGEKEEFHHLDKKVINFRREFFPDSPQKIDDDTEVINDLYQLKKKHAYKVREEAKG